MYITVTLTWLFCVYLVVSYCLYLRVRGFNLILRPCKRNISSICLGVICEQLGCVLCLRQYRFIEGHCMLPRVC